MSSNLRFRDYASPTSPLADFFTNQLPQLLSQHKRLKENRIQEKEMAQMRLDNQKELNQQQADLRAQQTLQELELNSLFSELDNAKKLLKETDNQAKDFGILSTSFKTPDLNKTEGGEFVLERLQNNLTQNRNFAVTNFNSLEETKNNVLEKLDEIKAAQRVNDKILEGANVGARVATVLKDLDGDEELTTKDLEKYFQTEDAILKNLDEIQQIGFDKTFPTAVETFEKKLDNSYIRDLRKKEAKLKEIKALESSKANAKDPRAIHRNYMDGYKNDKPNEKFKARMNISPVVLGDKDSFKDTQFFKEQTSNLAKSIFEGINYLERNMFNNTKEPVEEYLDEYKDLKNDEQKKEALSKWIKSSGIVDDKGNFIDVDKFHDLLSGNFEDTSHVYKHLKHFYDLYRIEKFNESMNKLDGPDIFNYINE